MDPLAAQNLVRTLFWVLLRMEVYGKFCSVARKLRSVLSCITAWQRLDQQDGVENQQLHAPIAPPREASIGPGLQFPMPTCVILAFVGCRRQKFLQPQRCLRRASALGNSDSSL